jgi:gluconate kinase
MKEALLRSQCDTLEEPIDALTLDIAREPVVLISRIREVFGLP